MQPAEPYLAVCEGALHHPEDGGGEGADALQGQLLHRAQAAHAACQHLQQLHDGLTTTESTAVTPATPPKAAFLS